MKTTVLAAATLAASLLAMTSVALADGTRRMRDPGVNHRQAHYTGRIAQGVKSGQLTRDEARELRSERRDIHQQERAYKSDGRLTQGERKDLHRELNQQRREIYEEKHDDEVRPGR